MTLRPRDAILVGLLLAFGCSEAREENLSELAKKASEVPFPHPANWAEKSSHGLTAINIGRDECAVCHGDDFTGGASRVSCFSCHASYPHSAGWQYPASHGASTLTAAATVTESTATCALCHGDDFQGADTKFSCYDCHAFPHLTGWVTGGTSHGIYLQGRGFDLTNCSPCHGADLSGGTAKVSCSSCHSLYPHTEPQWVQPGSGAFHGDTVVSLGGPSACTLCHGADYDGGNSGVSCFSCHSLYPHSSDWASTTHPPYVDANGDGACIDCHQTIKSSLTLSPIQFPNCQFCHK